jgi:hypothetical protein
MLSNNLSPRCVFLIVLVLALTGPLILFPIEYLFPYPHVVEELFKLSVVLFVINIEKISKRNFFWGAVSFGLLFVLSESIFYLINILASGQHGDFFLRITYTTPLHLGTVILLYLGFRQRSYVWGGLALLLSIIFHYYYNLLI